MPRVRLSEDEDPVINLAPMIDVILVLTIFFMCATKFSGDEHKFDLDLPQVSSGQVVGGSGSQIVEVSPSGGIKLDGEEVDLEGLLSRLKEQKKQSPNISVLIRGDKAVAHGRMAEVYEACRQSQVIHVAISVQTGGAARR